MVLTMSKRLHTWDKNYSRLEHAIAAQICPIAWKPIPRFSQEQGIKHTNGLRVNSLLWARQNLEMAIEYLASSLPRVARWGKATLLVGKPIVRLLEPWIGRQMHLAQPLTKDHHPLPPGWDNEPPDLEMVELPKLRYSIAANLPPGSYIGTFKDVVADHIRNTISVSFDGLKPIDDRVFQPIVAIDDFYAALTPKPKGEKPMNVHTYKVIFIDGTNEKRYGYYSPTEYKMGDYVLVDSPLTGRTAPVQIVEAYYNVSQGFHKAILGRADPMVYRLEIATHERRDAERIRAHKRRELQDERRRVSTQLNKRRDEVQLSIWNDALARDAEYTALWNTLEAIDGQIAEIGS